LVAAAAVMTLGGCAGGTTETTSPPVPKSPLSVRATPQQEGSDLHALDRANLNGITSLLVARHGPLVVERYYGSSNARRTRDLPVLFALPVVGLVRFLGLVRLVRVSLVCGRRVSGRRRRLLGLARL
jgi:hypothetical protein